MTECHKPLLRLDGGVWHCMSADGTLGMAYTWRAAWMRWAQAYARAYFARVRAQRIAQDQGTRHG